MGLKVGAFGPFKSTKTTFVASMAEVGPIGVIDSEARWQWITAPHPTIKPQEAPFHQPRILRPDLEYLPKTQNVVYLVETQELQKTGEAAEAFTARPELIGLACDSGSVLWDLLQDIRDPNPKLGMLSWGEIKRFWRRMLYAMASGGKHFVITAHAQDVYKKVGEELITIGTRPWLEKKTPHWLDMVLEFHLPERGAMGAAGVPEAKIIGEGIGGVGGLRKGTIITLPTFAGLLKRITFVPTAPTEIDPAELDYRNASAVERLAGGNAAVRPGTHPADKD